MSNEGLLSNGFFKNVRKTLFVRFYEGNITFIIVLFIYLCKIKVYRKSFESLEHILAILPGPWSFIMI